MIESNNDNGDSIKELVKSSTESVMNSESESDKAPLPPPRPKKKSRDRAKLQNLKLEDTSYSLDFDDSHQNDILFRTDSCLQLRKTDSFLKGE